VEPLVPLVSALGEHQPRRCVLLLEVDVQEADRRAVHVIPFRRRRQTCRGNEEQRETTTFNEGKVKEMCLKYY
jgi:hypothetical protein